LLAEYIKSCSFDTWRNFWLGETQFMERVKVVLAASPEMKFDGKDEGELLRERDKKKFTPPRRSILPFSFSPLRQQITMIHHVVGGENSLKCRKHFIVVETKWKWQKRENSAENMEMENEREMKRNRQLQQSLKNCVSVLCDGGWWG
jgi:hypothetical protein